MTKDKKIEYEIAFRDIKRFNFNFEYNTVKAILILIEEYGLYYNGAEEESFYNIEASKTLSKILENYVALEHSDRKPGRWRVAYSAMPHEVEKALQAKALQVLERRRDRANERTKKAVEEINTKL